MEVIDMWQFIALIITIIGVTFIYLSNRHQTMFSKPLAKLWRWIGLIFCFLALFIWLQLLVVSSAVFTWLFTFSVALVCVPLLSLTPLFSKFKR